MTGADGPTTATAQPAADLRSANTLERSPRRNGGFRPEQALIVALLVLPLVVSIGVLLIRVGGSFHGLGDNGQNEMHTRDVLHRLVLVGPYSRDGWNHLGPAMFYVLAVPYRIFGSDSAALNMGALLINAAAVVGIAAIAWRRGGMPAFLLTALGISVVMRSLGAEFLRDPWNPFVTVLPFGLLLYVMWELAAGRAWALPASVALGSFLVQTHVGYLPLVAPLIIGGAVWLGVLVGRRANDFEGRPVERTGVVRAAGVTGVVLVAMWALPFVGYVRGTPGNIRAAARYFVHVRTDHTLLQGYRVVAAQFSARPEWILGRAKASPFSGEPHYLFHSPLPWIVIPLLLAILFLFRARNKPAGALGIIVVVAVGLGVLAVSRTVGPVYAYRLRWTWVIGMAAGVVIVWAAWTALTRSFNVSTRLLVVPVVGGICALTVANVVSAARTSTPARPESRILEQLVPPVMKALPDRPGVVLVNGPSFASNMYRTGTMLWLERNGIAVKTNDVAEAPQGVGEHRVYQRGLVRAVVTFADDDLFDRMFRDPRQHLVAYVGRTPPAARAAVARSIEALGVQHQSRAISDADWIRRSGALMAQIGPAIGAFMSSP